MRLTRTARQLCSWIAVLAVLMAALAPSISHALGSKNGSSWIELCTSLGAKWVAVDDAGADEAPAPVDAHPFEHCAYCSLHANVAVLPAGPATSVACLLPAHGLPIAFLAAPRTLHAWVSAQPRAPPLFS